jgi:Bromodomain
MSAAPDQIKDGELEAARKAVVAALLDANVNVLFGSPVDTSALTDYLDIVDNPKDLGTVLADLESSLEGTGPYKSAADVFNDVLLVWSNCLKYNDRPEDKAIVDICKRSAKLFEREWRKAGLEVIKGKALHVNSVQLGGEPSSSKAVDEKGTLYGYEEHNADQFMYPLRVETCNHDVLIINFW